MLPPTTVKIADDPAHIGGGGGINTKGISQLAIISKMLVVQLVCVIKIPGEV